MASRRFLVALALLAACAAGLRGALYGHWDSYGALQLPLVFEAGCAAVITVMVGSPFGEPERATGRWLPFLRLGSTAALTGFAVCALAVAGAGAHLSGGFADVLRNVAGMTGIGLLCAFVLGAALAWIGPTAYLLVGVYALYTDWHTAHPEHTLDLAGSPAARRRRCPVRRHGVRRRVAGDHDPRSPGIPR